MISEIDQFYVAPDIHESGTNLQTETLLPAEHIRLNIDALMDENRNADNGIQKWHEIRNNEGNFVADRCADARVAIWLPPEYIYDISNIATAAPKERYQPIFRYNKTAGIITMTHIDGETLLPGIRPWGCGGQLAFGSMSTVPEVFESSNSAEYVRKEIFSDDAIKQAAKSATDAAKHSDVDVLAGVIDHVYGDFYPFGIVKAGGLTFDSAIPITDIMEPNGNEGEIYQNGLPIYDKLPDNFQKFVSEQRRHADMIRQKYPRIFMAG
jgi:hypothetical protein